jgi:hypothetical protein
MAFGRRFTHGKDRGSAVHGAKRYIVTADMQLIDHALAKQHKIEGTFFQSGAEAKRWIGLNILQRAGKIRNLRRQIRYDLHVVRPDGLKEKIGTWAADHVYDEPVAIGPDDPRFATGGAWAWVEVVEDVKGHPEDLYLWKKKHVQAEYGFQIREVKK